MTGMGPPVVWIHPDAPAKPALGAPCNGCGLCCLSEPCPVGIVVSFRRTGPCRALRWDFALRRYRCGLLREAGGGRLAAPARWLQAALRRWIAAGAGCDAELQKLPASPTLSDTDRIGPASPATEPASADGQATQAAEHEPCQASARDK